VKFSGPAARTRIFNASMNAPKINRKEREIDLREDPRHDERLLDDLSRGLPPAEAE